MPCRGRLALSQCSIVVLSHAVAREARGISWEANLRPAEIACDGLGVTGHGASAHAAQEMVGGRYGEDDRVELDGNAPQAYKSVAMGWLVFPWTGPVCSFAHECSLRVCEGSRTAIGRP